MTFEVPAEQLDKWDILMKKAEELKNLLEHLK